MAPFTNVDGTAGVKWSQSIGRAGGTAPIGVTSGIPGQAMCIPAGIVVGGAAVVVGGLVVVGAAVVGAAVVGAAVVGAAVVGGVVVVVVVGFVVVVVGAVVVGGTVVGTGVSVTRNDVAASFQWKRAPQPGLNTPTLTQWTLVGSSAGTVHSTCSGVACPALNVRASQTRCSAWCQPLPLALRL